ncbi:MAG: amidohydrolase [Gemmatimonadota bacterium]|nr:amidohydrolase [Gemmatimonadota bacterium]MDH5760507.1 amidohydrolase [Gemmatimonadota bacterium]
MRSVTVIRSALALAFLAPLAASAQNGKEMVASFIDAHATEYAQVAQQIWDWAEVGYLETQSSALLQETLRAEGFSIEAGVAGIPTAFVAEWSQGTGPTVGILGEFDALPGINQDRTAERNPIEGKGAGHACGHHLFGTGSAAAAIAVKHWMEETGQGGTLRMYGTPAEEGGAGKVYMVRAGLFDDVDVVLHWHAGNQNEAGASSTLANKSAKFRFSGISAHAAGAPERGRSALDGVEAMNNMVNMMREHVPQETRIHYVITYGGAAPNVIPDFAEVFYYVRNPDPENVKSIFERVVKAAQGAAMGTGTTVDYEVIHGLYNLLPNVALQEAMHTNLEQVGGVEYTDEERRFAEAIHATLHESAPPIERAAMVEPFLVTEEGGGGSTDVADVSWMVPTAGMSSATWVPGTSAHSWQAVAAGGTSIGNKGLVVAAKTLAMTAIDVFTRPDLIAAAKAEHEERIPEGWIYEPLIGDRDPPLDYRKPARAGGN